MKIKNTIGSLKDLVTDNGSLVCTVASVISLPLTIFCTVKCVKELESREAIYNSREEDGEHISTKERIVDVVKATTPVAICAAVNVGGSIAAHKLDSAEIATLIAAGAAVKANSKDKNQSKNDDDNIDRRRTDSSIVTEVEDLGVGGDILFKEYYSGQKVRASVLYLENQMLRVANDALDNECEFLEYDTLMHAWGLEPSGLTCDKGWPRSEFNNLVIRTEIVDVNGIEPIVSFRVTPEPVDINQDSYN